MLCSQLLLHPTWRAPSSATAFAGLLRSAPNCLVLWIPAIRPHYRKIMSDIARIASVAALLGDPARANILVALIDGRALTAKELAFAAHVSPQTTSGHLARLTDAGLLTGAKQGRHRYFRLASPLVGQMLESVMAVAAPESARLTTWRGGEALRTARTCYDHLAGRLGVALADSLVASGLWYCQATAARSRMPDTASCRRSAWNRPPENVCSAVPAWTGASAARIWPGAWVPLWQNAASPWDGPSGSGIRAR
jgi:DNA-binding transcriptional ArsR family regulator